MTRRTSRSLIQICAYLALYVAMVAADQGCDKTKCPGPLAHYESLGCTPVYEKNGDCCATRYNCDHLKARSKNKCYVNGKVYDIRENLRDEDANPCDLGCTCMNGTDGIARFVCAEVDCFFGPEKTGCYRKNTPANCCPGEEVCPKDLEERAICNVNGKIYRDGEHFEIEGELDLNCVCQPGYTGRNVEPFCIKPKHPYCSPYFRSASNIFNKCAPVYYSTQSPQTSCSVFSRCQNDKDVVIRKRENNSKSTNNDNDENACYFGNMTMYRGDELNQATFYSSVCVRCVCEVPPVPTCQRLLDNECDITKHPSFDNL